MATPKKPAPGKTFTKKVTVEKQQNFTARTGTADMRSKAKPAPKAAKPIIGRTSQDPKVKAQLNAKMTKAPAKKQGGSAPKISKDMTKAVAGNKGSNPIKGAVKRVGTVAREARDVVTAVGTVARAAATDSRAKKGSAIFTPGAAKNLKTQVKETVKAATTGKSGTTSNKLKSIPQGIVMQYGQPRKKSK